KVPSQLFKLATLLWSELIRSKLNINLVERAAELEGHLRVVFVDDRRPRVFADIETLVERKPKRLGKLNATLGDLLAADDRRSSSRLAGTAAIVCEIENQGVLAGRQRVLTCDAVFVLLLIRVPVSVLIGDGVGKHWFSIEDEQPPAAEPPALRYDH